MEKSISWKKEELYAKVASMDQEIQELNEKIDTLTDMVKENNRMVTSLYRRARISAALVFFKWFVVIGIAVGAFYFLQPVVDSLMGVYGSFTGGGNGADMIELFKSLR